MARIAHVSARVAQGLHYYSLLRPLSELAVARQFTRSARYDLLVSEPNPMLAAVRAVG